MKKSSFLLIILISASQFIICNSDTQKAQDICRIIEITTNEKTVFDCISIFTDATQKEFGLSSTEVTDLFQKIVAHLKSWGQQDLLRDLYDSGFTAAEIKDLLKFYQSSTGKKLFCILYLFGGASGYFFSSYVSSSKSNPQKAQDIRKIIDITTNGTSLLPIMRTFIEAVAKQISLNDNERGDRPNKSYATICSSKSLESRGLSNYLDEIIKYLKSTETQHVLNALYDIGFCPEEVRGLLQFYQSSTGKKLFSVLYCWHPLLSVFLES
jgi:hypothetical protein